MNVIAGKSNSLILCKSSLLKCQCGIKRITFKIKKEKKEKKKKKKKRKKER